MMTGLNYLAIVIVMLLEFLCDEIPAREALRTNAFIPDDLNIDMPTCNQNLRRIAVALTYAFNGYIDSYRSGCEELYYFYSRCPPGGYHIGYFYFDDPEHARLRALAYQRIYRLRCGKSKVLPTYSLQPTTPTTLPPTTVPTTTPRRTTIYDIGGWGD